MWGGWFLPRSSMLGLFLAAAASSRRQVPKNHLLSIIFWDLHGNHALLNQDCHKTPGLTRSSKLDRDLEREGWSMTCPFRLDDSVLGGDPSRLESFLITNIIIWVIRSSYYWHKGVTPMYVIIIKIIAITRIHLQGSHGVGLIVAHVSRVLPLPLRLVVVVRRPAEVRTCN